MARVWSNQAIHHRSSKGNQAQRSTHIVLFRSLKVTGKKMIPSKGMKLKINDRRETLPFIVFTNSHFPTNFGKSAAQHADTACEQYNRGSCTDAVRGDLPTAGPRMGISHLTLHASHAQVGRRGRRQAGLAWLSLPAKIDASAFLIVRYHVAKAERQVPFWNVDEGSGEVPWRYPRSKRIMLLPLSLQLLCEVFTYD